MIAPKWRLFWLAALIVLVITNLTIPFTVQAQSVNQVTINSLETVDTPEQNGLTLNVFFTLTDSLKKAVTNPNVQTATIALDPEDGGNYQAKVEKATGPISIVMVLDTSGSMGGAMKKMQDAAAQMAGNLPQGSRIAVLRFSDTIETVQPFTTDKNSVSGAISKLRSGGGTCLFDATFAGVELMASEKPGRRAVIVFTDGKDETAQGTICSKHPLSDVLTLATNKQNRTPIYTIGLRGSQPIAEADLRNMSDGTGGSAAIGNDPAALFKDIVDALNSQLVATALTFPRDGERNLTLRIAAQDSSPVADSGTFISPKDYSIKPTATPTVTPTPPPVLVVINTIQQDLVAKELIIAISTRGEEQVAQYRFDLINQSGTLQSEKVFAAPLKEPARLPMGDLPAGDFTVRVDALDKDGNLLVRSQEARGKYLPTATPAPTATGTALPISATLDTITYEDPVTKQTLILKLLISGKDQISRIRATLSDAKTGVTVKEYDPLPVEDVIKLGLQGVPPTEYNVNVFAIGASGQQLSLSTQKFVFDLQPTPTPLPSPTPTPEPGGLVGALNDPAKRPIVLGIFGVLVVGLVLLMIVLVVRRPKKPASGTAFLREMTGAVDVRELQGYAGGARTSKPDNAPAKAPMADYDKTSPIQTLMLPPATLYVERSKDPVNVSKTVQISKVPFILGRRKADINFDADDGVSREHARITFDNTNFNITDNGSTNGTFVDDVRLQPDTPKALQSGAVIRLGANTAILFKLTGNQDYDMDKTSPEPFRLS